MQPMPDIAALMKIARSPAGQQLLSMLQADPSTDLNAAAAAAATGDLAAARQKIIGALRSPEAQELLKQLEQQL